MDAAAAQRALNAVQAALQHGRLDEAEQALAPLRKAYPHQKAVLYLTARHARAKGDPAAAARHLKKALATTPQEAPLWAEYASTLDDAGRYQEADKAYGRALDIEPGLVDAAIDRAVLQVTRLGRSDGLEELQRLAEANPRHARAWRNLAAISRSRFETSEAIAASEHALDLAPSDPAALSMRALAERDSGRPSAAFFVRARKAAPSDAGLAVQHAVALLAEGQTGAADALLEQVLAAQPFHEEALRAQARLRWEQGIARPLAGFERAVGKPGCSSAIWAEYVRLSERHDGAQATLDIVARAEAVFGNTPEVAEMRARVACEADDPEQHEAVFAEIAKRSDPGARLLRCRFLARLHRFDELSGLAERLLRDGYGREVLPYLSLAWRGMGDDRWHWLERDGDLVGTFEIGARVVELDAIAEHIRAIHTASRQPLEQSLRGGTQTDGMLFARLAPEIEELRRAVEDCIAEYLADLPPRDPKHPWLSLPRNDARLVGAWSVRLQGEGYHVAHIHDRGDISSASYLALPDTVGRGGGNEGGWLAIGEPPREFGLDWEPLRLIEPREGMLVLFPSWQWHGTRPFSTGERLTVAFDVALR